MSWQRRIFVALFPVFLAFACVSCESSSSSSSDDPGTAKDPLPLSGTWQGYFLAGDDVVTKDSEDDAYDDIYQGTEFDIDDDDIYVAAIITRELEARFIGDTTTFVCDEGSLGVKDVINIRKFLGADLDAYTWNTGSGGEWAGDWYHADVVPHNIWGNTWLTNSLIGGLYWETGSEVYRQFQVYGYSSSGISPNIAKLAHEWKIENAFKGGNTLTFIIADDGSISGKDDEGNSFDGTIEIHYDADTPRHEIYNVNLTLDPIDPTYPPVDLVGLATYIASTNDETNEVEESLAIGVTSDNHLVTGIAAKVIPK